MTLATRFFDAVHKAEKKGLKLTESGAPRGEPRWYHLEDPHGARLKESTSISAIEQAISRYVPINPPC